MIFAWLPNFINLLFTPFIDALPVLTLPTVLPEYWTGFLSFIELVSYFIPFYAFGPLFSIIFTIIFFKIFIAFLKLIIEFIPFF